MDLAPATSFQCPHCEKFYKRPEHLQRHVASHLLGKSHRCFRCGTCYRRSDVLARHEKTCKGQRPSLKTKHVYRRASDADQTNAAIMRYQSGSVDLHTCAISSPGTGPQTEPQDINWLESTTNDTFQDFVIDSEIHSHIDVSEFDSLDSDGPESLNFLARVTRNTGLLPSFDCGTHAQRLKAHTQFTSTLPKYGRLDDPLSLKSHEIITIVEEAVRVKPKNSSIGLTCSAVLEDLCIAFFAPDRIRLNLELYFAVWHPNVNIVHKATFDYTTAKASLVAAMCIIGACVSPLESDRKAAWPWLDCVEEAVFRDEDLCYERETLTTLPPLRCLQALQAAYMVCLFQNWEGDEAAKRRIRRFKYSIVVAVGISRSSLLRVLPL